MSDIVIVEPAKTPPAAAGALVGLAALGWDDQFAAAFAGLDVPSGAEPARIVTEHRGGYRVVTASGETAAELSGRLRFAAVVRPDLPVVGDWVAITGRVVHAIVPRRTVFVRRHPDPRVGDQALAANVDVAFLVTSLNHDFNLRRLERFLTMAWSSGARPVVVLSKADLVGDPEGQLDEVRRVAIGAPIVVASVPLGIGLDDIRSFMSPGRTAAFLGSSGVGKSTLINALAGEDRQSVGAVREDDARGRHTTSSRNLLLLSSGWLVIDTPGIRELALSDDGADVDQAFADIDEIAANCRFSDCAHEAEPGCQVRAALADGRLDPARLESHRKLEREVARAARAVDPAARAAHKNKWRTIHRAVNDQMNRKYGAER